MELERILQNSSVNWSSDLFGTWLGLQVVSIAYPVTSSKTEKLRQDKVKTKCWRLFWRNWRMFLKFDSDGACPRAVLAQLGEWLCGVHPASWVSSFPRNECVWSLCFEGTCLWGIATACPYATQCFHTSKNNSSSWCSRCFGLKLSHLERNGSL